MAVEPLNWSKSTAPFFKKLADQLQHFLKKNLAFHAARPTAPEIILPTANHVLPLQHHCFCLPPVWLGLKWCLAEWAGMKGRGWRARGPLTGENGCGGGGGKLVENWLWWVAGGEVGMAKRRYLNVPFHSYPPNGLNACKCK